jgi:AmiR/NasT family two-component response regulator
LLVDDDVLISNDVADLLAEAGHTVIGTAQDGRQALAMARALKPDIVFMDIEMPELDGLEATRQIQEQCPVPVILLTAHDDPDLVVQGSRVGATAYLVKPPDLGEMTRTMVMARARFEEFLELRRLNAQLRQSLAEIKTLRGLLPICANCKKIRDEQGYWQQVEVYFRAHAGIEFTHSLCEPCLALLYPEHAQELASRTFGSDDDSPAAPPA